MSKHICAEVIIIPFKTMLEILFYCFPRDICEMTFLYVPVKGPQPYIKTYRLGSGSPKCLVFMKTYIRTVGQYRL